MNVVYNNINKIEKKMILMCTHNTIMMMELLLILWYGNLAGIYGKDERCGAEVVVL